tara:strand:+ start:284 stop:487 length:204 start_codon:yes stop_codon:yes gene_type:complete
MSNYEKMIGVALFIAPPDMNEWTQTDIVEMAETCGETATLDFFKNYSSRFGYDCSKQIAWLNELMED